MTLALQDALSLEGVEHREWHNLYGFYQQMATAQGQVRTVVLIFARGERGVSILGAVLSDGRLRCCLVGRSVWHTSLRALSCLLCG